MRFLADECVHAAIATALRRAGHEVETIGPDDVGGTDEAVLERAVRRGAVLLTADKDFGEIVWARRATAHGVVLFRRSAAHPTEAADRLLGLIHEHGQRLQRLYIVVTPDRSRIRRLDEPGPSSATPA